MHARLALLVVAMVALPAPAAGALAPADQSPVRDASGGDVLVVDPDGAGHETIGAAVAAADDGDTVRVTPGTYRETVTLAENVTLVAPRGATLDGSSLDDSPSAFEVDGPAAPTVDGFTVTGYGAGVWAASTTGDWVVRNTTFRDVGTGVSAIYSTGDWTVRNASVVDAGDGVGGGIEATESTGDWRIVDTVVRNVTEGRGVEASPSAGDWTVRNVTVVDVDFVGVEASSSSGDWRVVNSTVRDALVGVGAVEASGDWTVRGSTVANASTSGRFDFRQPPLTEGAAVDASGTNGSWTVRGSRLVDSDAAAIVADGAAETGDATHNYFGTGGPGPGDCTGAVDCSAPLSTWPPATPVPADTPARTDDGGPTSTAPDTASPDGSGRSTTGASSPTPTSASPATTTSPPLTHSPTPATTPLPGWLAPLALLVGALVVARRR